MSSEPEIREGGGPLLALVARGLELWLRGQCDAIGELEIRLDGSVAQLLRGRLEGVRLAARRVVFQRLEIERVELRSEAIRVRVGSLLRRQTLELENPFLVQGRVVFTGEGLSRSLTSPPWSGLGDDLADALLGLTPLSALRLQEDLLILSSLPLGAGEPVERTTRLAVDEGGLAVHPLDGGRMLRVPVDPDIRIERAAVSGGRLELEGEARVIP